MPDRQLPVNVKAKALPIVFKQISSRTAASVAQKGVAQASMDMLESKQVFDVNSKCMKSVTSA